MSARSPEINNCRPVIRQKAERIGQTVSEMSSPLQKRKMVHSANKVPMMVAIMPLPPKR